jgi:hypothetical protein
MAKNKNYFENVASEINDVYQAYKRRVEMQNTPGPGTDSMANKLRGIEDRQVGQLAMAVLQGRRYDNKGRQIKKTKGGK